MIPAWHARAACAGNNVERFYTPDNCYRGNTRVTRKTYLQEAKAVCARCPVRMDCLRDALNRKEPYGVWGGLDEVEREVLRKQLALPAHLRDVDCLRKQVAS